MELLIAFLRFLKTDLRIVLMSATISNPGKLAEWLSPCDVINNVPRYPALDKWVYCFGNDESVDEALTDEVTEILRAGSASVLVFVYQTASAEKLARYLATRITGKSIRPHDLAAVMNAGVAWFHARLSAATRAHIVEAMASGKIRVAVSTTALSLGVNLPATHVFVRDISFTGFGDLDIADLMQMIGRAGRGDQAGVGTVILSGNNLMKEELIAAGLTRETVPEIRSQLVFKKRESYYGSLQEELYYLDRVGNQVMGILNRYGNITMKGVEEFLSYTFGGSRFTSLPAILQKLAEWKLSYLNEDTNEFELTHLGKASSLCYTPSMTAANIGQLFRDLLENDANARHISSFSPIDYLIAVCLVSDENKSIARYSKSLETKVHSYMESLPFNEKSYLYSAWILSSPEALYGSARVDGTPGEAKKKVYQATFLAMFIYDISRGFSRVRLDAYYKVDSEELQERFRDNALWILSGLKRILRVKSFFYHLKENCHAEREQVHLVEKAFQKSSHTIFTLMNHLKFRSPLGEMVRSIQSVFPNEDSYPGEGTIRRLEAAGITSVKDLMGKTREYLISIGVRSDYAALITSYIQKRMA